MTPVITGPQITRPAPRAISKSTAKSTDCPRHFALSRMSAKVMSLSEPAELGTSFHRYRAEYIKYLRATAQTSDSVWAKEAVTTMQLVDDAMELVLDDIETFKIDPALVWGVELYVSVDDEFNPLVMDEESVSWKERMDQPNLFAHGIFDLLSVSGAQAVVDDYKTGYGYADDYEADHLAALVFAHFPWIEHVTVNWDYIRKKKKKPIEFLRSDFGRLQTRIKAKYSYMLDLAEIADKKGVDALPVNPFSGLCGMCSFTCPLKADVLTKKIDLAPIQDIEQALLATQYWVAAKSMVSQAEAALKAFLPTQPNGTLKIGQTHELSLEMGHSKEYPLDKTLSAIGYELSEAKGPDGNKFDVMPSSLSISASDLHRLAKTKKRRGMQEALDSVADLKPRQTLKLTDLQKKQNEGKVYAI